MREFLKNLGNAAGEFLLQKFSDFPGESIGSVVIGIGAVCLSYMGLTANKVPRSSMKSNSNNNHLT